MKKVKKASTNVSVAQDATPDFMALEGGAARGTPKTQDKENKSTVLYIGRIPHGFYENEMEAFFKQFGTIKRLGIARNRKTGKLKHFGFIEFESPEVAKVVEECMHNYLMFEHLLQVCQVPSERVNSKLWKGVDSWYQPSDWVQIERKRQDKERTLQQQQKLVEGIIKRDQKRRKRIEAADLYTLTRTGDSNLSGSTVSFSPLSNSVTEESQEGERGGSQRMKNRFLNPTTRIGGSAPLDDVSEATHDSKNFREAVSQGSAPLAMKRCSRNQFLGK